MINRVVLVGRLGADPELRVTGSGHSVCTLRLAVRRVRAQQGQQDTDWINVEAWSKTAEFCANYLKKGYLVGVDGRLQVREWETQAGEKRRVYEVVADSVQNLQPRDRTGDVDVSQVPAASAASRQPQSEAPPSESSPAPGIAEDIDRVFPSSTEEFDPYSDA